jgi:cytochrome c oxidase subunit 2
MINLAAEYGWGPYTLMWIFIIVVVIAAAGFLIVMASSRTKKKIPFAVKRKYHFEMFWALGIAGVLIWLWIISFPWMPPVAFSAADSNNSKDLQVVNITAGQWFWLTDLATVKKPLNPSEAPGLRENLHFSVIAGKPVKFVAHSVDVNHGLGIFKGTGDGAPILLQMQVVPEQENVFYYTFKEPGTYFIRCLEYCGYAHPYMTSSIKVVAEPGSAQLLSEMSTAGGS